jgi:hypothetical protein
MGFKLTYTDGSEAEYDDGTAWEVDDGVLKMGRTEGDWTVLVSPSHWAVIEVGNAAPPERDGDDEKDGDADKDAKDGGDPDKGAKDGADDDEKKKDS